MFVLPPCPPTLFFCPKKKGCFGAARSSPPSVLPSPPEIGKGEEKKNKNGSDFFWGDGQKRGRSVGRGAELKVVPSLPPPSHFPAVHTGGAAARSGRRIEGEGEVCLFEVGWMEEEEEEGKGG